MGQAPGGNAVQLTLFTETNSNEGGGDPPRPGPDARPGELTATVKRVRFESPESGFAVLVMRCGIIPEFVAVGTLAGFRAGQDLHLTGRWTVSERFGEQFRVNDVEAVAISSLDGIQAHLEDCPVKGVGPRVAATLVRLFGLQTWDVIATEPERLADVPGLRATVAADLHAYARDHRDLALLASLLRKGGVGPATARRVHAFYTARGADPVEVLRGNPYQVARDVDRIGFERADRIAEAIGLPRDDGSRIRAGLRHVLARAAETSGHCYLPQATLLEEATRLLMLPSDVVAPVLAQLLDDPAELLQPDRVCADRDAAYLAPLLDAERAIAEAVHRLLARAPAVPEDAIPDAIARAEAQRAARDGVPDFTYNEHQRRAIRQLAEANLVIVTGGPGTGKTTLVQGLITALEALGMPVSLAALTGRASQRLRESTGRHASTVHRLMGYEHGGGFRSGRCRKLRGALIVDEFSMMDAWLSAHLFRALEPGFPVVLVGDVDQLPSVGPGAVLRHLIDSEVVPTVRLEVPIRQAAGSTIVANAHRVNGGQAPEFPEDDGECRWLELADLPGEEAAALVVEQALALCAEFGGPMEAQVLAPMKRGPLGVDALNAALQERLNPPGPPELRHGGTVFRQGDKVIQTRNDYDRGVMNGEIGIVTAVGDGRIEVEFRTRETPGAVAYASDDLDHLRIAYAITIHKSQGSEYGAVLVVLHDSQMFMLQRNLLYTALTRARKRVVLAGTRKALRRAVKNAQITARHSRLMERLRAAVRVLVAPEPVAAPAQC